MLKFSQRIGVTPIPSALQKDSMTPELRNSLWNICYFIVKKSDYKAQNNFYGRLWVHFFKFPVDEIVFRSGGFFDKELINSELVERKLKAWFADCVWHDVYYYLEFVLSHFPLKYNYDDCNDILARELSAYRFIDGVLVEITSDREIKEIENALEKTSPYPLVTQHLRKSMNLLSDRTAPDYQNSIKESISSVEALLRHFTSDNSIILSKALIHPLLKKHFHPTLLDSLGKLYSYRGDQSGIGHSSKPESNFTVNSHDAKFFLIVCSAYINLIITTLSKIPPDAK